MWFNINYSKDHENIDSHFHALYPDDIDMTGRLKRPFKEKTIEDLQKEFDASLSDEALSSSNFRSMSGFFYTSVYETFDSEIIEKYEFEEYSMNEEELEEEDLEDEDDDDDEEEELQVPFTSSLAYNISQSPNIASPNVKDRKTFATSIPNISNSIEKMTMCIDKLDIEEDLKENTHFFDEETNQNPENDEDINAYELEQKLLQIFYRKYKHDDLLSPFSPIDSSNQDSPTHSHHSPPSSSNFNSQITSEPEEESTSQSTSSSITPKNASPLSPQSPSHILEHNEREEYQKLKKFSVYFQLPPYYFLKSSKILLLHLKRLRNGDSSVSIIQDIIESYDEKKEKILANIIGLIVKNLNLFFYYFNTIKKLKHNLLLILKNIKRSKKKLSHSNQNLYNILTSNMSLNNRYKNYKSLLDITKNLKLVKDYYVFIKKNSFINFFTYFNYNSRIPSTVITPVFLQHQNFVNSLNSSSIFYSNSMIVLYYIKLDKYLSKYSSVNTINEIKKIFPYYILLLKFKIFLQLENFFFLNNFSAMTYINFLYNFIYLDLLFEHSNNSLMIENMNKSITHDSNSVLSTTSDISKDFLLTSNNFLINSQQIFPQNFLNDIKLNYSQKEFFEIFNSFSLNFSNSLVDEISMTSYLPNIIINNLDASLNFHLKKILFINLWTNKVDSRNEKSDQHEEKNFFKDFFTDYFYNQNKNEKNFYNFSNFLNNFNLNFFFNTSSLHSQLSSIGYFCTQVFQILKFYHDLNLFHIKLFLIDIRKLNKKKNKEFSPSSSTTGSSFESPLSTPLSQPSIKNKFSLKYDEMLKNYEEVHSPIKMKNNSTQSSIISKNISNNTNSHNLETICLKDEIIENGESTKSIPYVLTSSIKSDITMDIELIRNHEEYEKNYFQNQVKLKNLEFNTNKLSLNLKNFRDDDDDSDEDIMSENEMVFNEYEHKHLDSPTLTSTSSQNQLEPLNCKDPASVSQGFSFESRNNLESNNVNSNKIYENLFYIIKKKKFFTNLNINKDLLKIICIRYYNIRKRILSNYNFLIKKIFFILIKIIKKISFFIQNEEHESELEFNEKRMKYKIKQKKDKKAFFFMLHSIHGLFYFIKNYNIKNLENFFDDHYMEYSENNFEDNFYNYISENYEKFEKINDEFLNSCQFNEKFFPKFEEKDENFNIFNDNFKKFFTRTKTQSTCTSENLTPSHTFDSISGQDKKFTFLSTDKDSLMDFFSNISNNYNYFEFYKNFIDEDIDSNVSIDSYKSEIFLNEFHEAINSTDNNLSDNFVKCCSINKIFLFLIELLQYKVEEFMNQNHHNSMNELKQLIIMDDFSPAYVINNIIEEDNKQNSINHFNNLIYYIIKKSRNFSLDSYVKNFSSYFYEFNNNISSFFQFFYSNIDKQSINENIDINYDNFFSFDDFNKNQNNSAYMSSGINSTENEYLNNLNEYNDQKINLFLVNFLKKKLFNGGIGDLKDLLLLNTNNKINLTDNEYMNTQFSSDETSNTKSSSSSNYIFNLGSPSSDLVFFNNSSKLLYLSSSFLNGIIKKSLNYYHLLLHCPYNFFFIWKKLKSLFLFYILSIYNIYYKNLSFNINLETVRFQNIKKNLDHFLKSEQFFDYGKDLKENHFNEDNSILYYNNYIEAYLNNFFLNFLHFNGNEKEAKKENDSNNFQYVKDFMPSYQDIKDNEFFLYYLNDNLYSPIFFHPYEINDSFVNSNIPDRNYDNNSPASSVPSPSLSTFSSFTSSNYSKASDDQSQYFNSSFFTPSFPHSNNPNNSNYNNQRSSSSVYSNLTFQNVISSEYLLNPFISFDFFNNPDNFYFNNFSSYSFIKDFLPEKNKNDNEIYEIMLICENCLILSEFIQSFRPTFSYFFSLVSSNFLAWYYNNIVIIKNFIKFMIKNIIKKFVKKIFTYLDIKSILKYLISKINWKSKILLDNFHSYINLLLFNAYNLWKIIDNFDNEDILKDLGDNSEENSPNLDESHENYSDDAFDVEIDDENIDNIDDDTLLNSCKNINKKFLSSLGKNKINSNLKNCFKNVVNESDSLGCFKTFMEEKCKNNKMMDDCENFNEDSLPEDKYRGFVKELFWLEICQKSFDILFECYINLKDCSIESRANMRMNIFALDEGLNNIHTMKYFFPINISSSMFAYKNPSSVNSTSISTNNSSQINTQASSSFFNYFNNTSSKNNHSSISNYKKILFTLKGKDFLNNYLKAFYLSEDELLTWLNNNFKFYSYFQISNLLNHFKINSKIKKFKDFLNEFNNFYDSFSYNFINFPPTNSNFFSTGSTIIPPSSATVSVNQNQSIPQLNSSKKENNFKKIFSSFRSKN